MLKASILGLKRQMPVSNIAKNISKGKKMAQFPGIPGFNK
jgi:hypothetical protein